MSQRFIHLILTLWACLGTVTIYSQSLVTVSGKVIDGVTKEPIPYAHVYLNNTTRGTTTDSLGQFTLQNIPLEEVDLVVSVIGYTTLKTHLNLTNRQDSVIEFRMTQDKKVLSEVVVKGDRIRKDKVWDRNYETFKSVLLGTSSNAMNSKIINPEVLTFKETPSIPVYKGYNRTIQNESGLKAMCSGPLEVINLALGFKVTISLQEFEASPSYYTILMSCRFDTLSPRNAKEQERWRINRLKTYYGSQVHLFRSIRKGRYTEEGFRITKTQAISEINPRLLNQNTTVEETDTLFYHDIVVDSSQNRFRVFRKGTYKVVYLNKIVKKDFRSFRDYPFPVSWIEVKDSSLTVNSMGDPILPADYWRMGYFDTQRVGDMLPLDYDPKSDELIGANVDITESSTIQGMVKDENGNPLAGVNVFIHQGLTGTTTNLWGQYQLSNLSPGVYEIGFYFGGKIPTIKITSLPVGEDIELNATLTPQVIEKIIPEKNPEYLLPQFETKLLNKEKIRLGDWKITNPYVLQFSKTTDRNIDVYATAPLMIESSTLGYRWTYFINEAHLKKTKKGYDLEINGPVKIDTLFSKKNIKLWQWKMNQFDEYEGSLNHFVVALTEGRLADEGFKVYQYNTHNYPKGKVHLKKAKLMMTELSPDSILTVANGMLYLSTPKGLEIHSALNKNKTRFYQGYSSYVYRIKEDSQVVVSPHGLIAPGLNLGNTTKKNLATLPVDYRSPYEVPTDKKVLFLLNKNNLITVKDLQEKVYLQTDRPYYYQGDTVWFKAYLKFSNQHFRDSLSRVLYVDLMNGPNNVISNHVLKIERGMAWGDLIAGTNLPAGDYFLRVYTQWMRNFEEYFWLHLPIISREYTLQSNTPRKIEAPIAHEIKPKLAFEKEIYKPREEVKATFNSHVGKSYLSVSVTDMSAVAELENVPTIYSLEKGFKGDSSTMMRIKYPVERALTVRGKVLNNSENNQVFAYIKGKEESILADVKDDQFEFLFDFYDTTSILLKSSAYNGETGFIELIAEDSVKTYSLPHMLTYNMVKNQSNTRFATYYGSDARLLNEVIIKAKRISIPPVVASQTQRRLGMPTQLYDYTTQPSFLRHIRKSYNVLTALSTMIPDFIATAQRIYQSTGTVDTVRNIGPYQRIYSIMLDGMRLEYNEVSSIPAQYISRIEVYKTPANQVDLISIYTENVIPIQQNFYRYQIRGYDRPSIFREPKITSSFPDYRSTIYWNPSIETNEDGVANFSFHTSDLSGSYRIVLEGISENGEIFRLVQILQIE